MRTLGPFLIAAVLTGQSGRAPDITMARTTAAELPLLNSLLVSHRGQLVLEYYRQPRFSRASNVKSVSKSIISALVGIAVERRLIPSVQTRIADYFPELTREPDERKRRITIEDLLTMRQGLESTSFDNYGAWVRSRNWVGYVLQRPLLSEPGTTMEYSTGSTHLLSAILTRATRRSTWSFAQEALGRPLGIQLPRWPRDPQGIFFGGNDMLLTPRQMVTFGELYLNQGRAGGRQVVPAGWVQTSCEGRGRSRFNPDQEYGYGWWIRDFAGERACFAWGYGGQYILVFPGRDLVIVTTSATTARDEGRGHRRQIFELVERMVK